MNKTLTILAMGFLLSVGFTTDSEAGGSMARGESMIAEAADLVGIQVENPAGEILGSVSDIIFDSMGRPALAILHQGDTEDFDVARYVAVPFSAQSITKMETSQVTAVLYIGKKTLYSAPRFDRTKNLEISEWADIYRYFGRQPYWTDEGIEKDVLGTDSP